MVKIVTSICIDTEESDKNILYKGLSLVPVESEVRRAIYWSLVTTFCCSSIRSNPEEDHYVYTNDPNEIVINRVNIHEFLKCKGIKIIFLPFQKYVPPTEYCRMFKNAYYKLEVLAELGTDENSVSILLDSDCLWHKHDEKLMSIINSDKYILLRDTFEPKDYWVKQHANISRADLGRAYLEIDPSYPTLYPIWYGGELIAGKGKNLQIIAKELKAFMDDAKARNLNTPISDKKNLYDGMECFSNFVYNKNLVDIYEAKQFIKRIYTTGNKPPEGTVVMKDGTYNLSQQDINLPIWHLPHEKQNGLQLIFKEVINPGSRFWKVPLEEFSAYLGSYVGIPQRKYFLKEPPLKRMLSKVKRGINKILTSK
jgi:hypothetical protein